MQFHKDIFLAIVEKNLEIFLWPPLLQSNPQSDKVNGQTKAECADLHLMVMGTYCAMGRASTERTAHIGKT